jgi:3-oxoacyl-[acyl-carrier-protein] synthase-1
VESRIAGPFVEAGYEIALSIVAKGHASMAYALLDVGTMLRDRRLDIALVLGVDSYYDPDVLEGLFQEQRVLDSDWRDSFVPGEAASAVLLARPDVARQLGLAAIAEIESVGTNEEVATIENDVGNLGLGLSRPAVAICKKMKQEKRKLCWWISDMTGETFRVQELQVAWPRAAHLVMGPQDTIDVLPTHLGDIGAATMPTSLCLAIEGLRRGSPRGDHALITGSSALGARGVILVRGREA